MLKGSHDSLGTRTLPERDSSVNLCGTSSDQILEHDATLPVALSDVSFFGDSDDETDGGHEFQRTLAIIKPDAVHLMYKIDCIMEQNGFIVIRKDVMRLTREQAAEFYSGHALELYFPQLVDHISSGPMVVYVLSKKNCVDEWRRLIGPADVRLAKRDFPVSLRAIYGTKTPAGRVANAFHGSHSPDEAKKEIRFFFPNSQVETNNTDHMEYIKTELMPTIAELLKEMMQVGPIDSLRWFGNRLLEMKRKIKPSE